MRIGVTSNTGKYKSFKEMPWWLKIVVIGLPGLVLLMLPTYFISLQTKEFDAQIEQKIERIHAQLAEGKFRDIYLEGDRELTSSYEENEFTAKLAPSQKYFTGKYRSSFGNSAHYPDVFNRLKRFFGRPALIGNYRFFESDAGKGSESFYWIIRGDEVKLADYGLNPQIKR